MPPSREQRVEQKRFYFDVGSNTRGVYLRISEVSRGLDCSSLSFFPNVSESEKPQKNPSSMAKKSDHRAYLWTISILGPLN